MFLLISALSACQVHPIAVIPEGRTGPGTEVVTPPTSTGGTETETTTPPGSDTGSTTVTTETTPPAPEIVLDYIMVTQSGVDLDIVLAAEPSGGQDGDAEVTLDDGSIYTVTFVEGIASLTVGVEDPCASIPSTVTVLATMDGVRWVEDDVTLVGAALSDAIDGPVVPDDGPLVLCGEFADAASEKTRSIVLSGETDYEFRLGGGADSVTVEDYGVAYDGDVMYLPFGSRQFTLSASAAGDYFVSIEKLYP